MQSTLPGHLGRAAAALLAASALVLAAQEGGEPPTPPPPSQELEASLARARAEQGLVRAERTAAMLAELERVLAESAARGGP